jgi:hypothetical protein
MGTDLTQELTATKGKAMLKKMPANRFKRL